MAACFHGNGNHQCSTMKWHVWATVILWSHSIIGRVCCGAGDKMTFVIVEDKRKMSMASAPTHCFHRGGNFCNLFCLQVHGVICRLTHDFVEGHGCNDDADGFVDCSFIGCW